ncbi:MAG: GHKL domain-containing protein [Blautia sp.]|nr:GHKL domain-containing protein [Lachnoclostridium sp.]MCM1212536.1 GHKL domain-containing protein [Blautia sp.]
MIIRNLKILMELFAYLYCLAELFGKKFKISIHAVVFIILDLFMMTGLNDYGFPEYLSSLAYLGMFLYGLLYYKESLQCTLVNCFLAAAIVSVLQLFMLLPVYYIFLPVFGESELTELLINAGCLGLIILAGYKVKLNKISEFCVKRNKLVVGAAALVFCGLGVSIYRMAGQKEVLTELYVQMIYFVLVFFFVIYEWQKSRMDVEKKKAQLEMNRLYYGAYDQLILLIRERQHDMKNHINAILSMIYTTDNYEELAEKQKEYCNEVLGKNEQTKLVVSSGNPLIVGFLYSKIQEAETKGIEVEYHIGMKKTDAFIPEYELVEMIGILMDNAIEALSGTDKETTFESAVLKKIRLMLQETETAMELTVANTSEIYEEDMTERFFESGYSSKGKGRGIGLSKLKRLVQDKRGVIIVSNELYGNRNYLTFTLQIPKRTVKQITKEKRQKSK